MIMGMSEPELERFLERISATAIANQAIVKCQLSGLDLTTDNVIFFVGDFVDPTKKGVEGLLEAINKAIMEVVEMPLLMKKGRRP